MLIKEFRAEKLLVKVYETRQSMGQAAADEVAAKIKELLSLQDEVSVVFASAPSQNEFLAVLAGMDDIDWGRVHAFHLDEYIGLDSDAPQGFGNFLKERIFSKRQFKTVNYMDIATTDPQAECARYTALLEKHKPDVIILGIGENGHLAFNDPGYAFFNDPEVVKVVELEHSCRQQQVNDGCFASLDLVPTHAITITIPPLMEGRFLYAIVPGPTKVEAVANTVNSEIDEMRPSTILRTHDNAALFIDQASAVNIKGY